MVDWDKPEKENINWNKSGIWEYIEQTEEDWLEGNVEALIVRDDNLSIPDDFSLAFGPADLGNRKQERNRIWICHRTIDGKIYLRQSDIEWEEYVYARHLVFAPIDSRYPSLIFNRDNNFIVFVELTPAHNYTEEGDHEIWILEPPYSGDGIREICAGRYPVAYDLNFLHPYMPETLSADKGIALFYLSQDLKTIYYRLADEDYENEYTVLKNDTEMALRVIYQFDKPYGRPYVHNDISRHFAVFFRDEESLKYITSEEMIRIGRNIKLEENINLNELNISANNISWQDVSPLDMLLNDEINLNNIEMNVSEISWIPLTPYNLNLTDKINLNDMEVSAEDINWQEVYPIEPKLKDKIDLSNNNLDITLESILWVQV